MCWHNRIELMHAYRPLAVVLLLTILADTDCSGNTRTAQAQPSQTKAAAFTAGRPATILIGQSWLGLWQGGKLVKRVATPQWQFNAARLSPDGSAVEIAAYPNPPSTTTTESATVLRYDARTLTLLGQKSDADAGNWQPLPPPVGTDDPSPVDTPAGLTLRPGETLLSAFTNRVLTATRGKAGTDLQVRTAAGAPVGTSHPVAGGTVHAALSPDGTTAAAFTKPAGKATRWLGQVWDVASGKAIPAPSLSVDDGAGRENQAPRALACLLPRGEGAILSYIGAPADRGSEFLSFSMDDKAAPLDAPYVMTCLSAGPAQ
jgi:hypothetical protein